VTPIRFEILLQTFKRDMMEFASDNTAGAHAAILTALGEANDGRVKSYGYDPWTKRAEEALSRVFEREVSAFLVLTGTAANALALSAIVPPYGAVLCHDEAHLHTDECGAPELFSGGAKLMPLSAAGGKISAAQVAQTLDNLARGEHESKPAAVSITQLTELGTAYSPAEIGALGDLCKARKLKFHMDGSRFANALVGMGCTAADMTWRAGVDVMSFGATKNGALALEAVIFFNQSLADDFRYRRKRAGQLLSKSRYLGAQMLALLENGLWLRNAERSNAMARLLAGKLAEIQGVRLPLATDGNQVFAIMPKRLHEAMLKGGAHYHAWPARASSVEGIGEGECLARFVASYQTTEEDVTALAQLARRLAGNGMGAQKGAQT
jgi:threonine aldolase